MLNKEVYRSAWGTFCDRLSRQAEASAFARVRSVRAEDWDGEQEEAWLPFLGVTYEPKGDVITVALEGLDHRIEHPEAVWAEEEGEGVVGRLEILGANGRRDEVEFRPYSQSDH